MKLRHAIIYVLAIFAIVSCNRDKCRAVFCQNGSVCEGGTCDCLSGYEGNLCELEIRQRYFGTYSCIENCSLSGAMNYTITMAASAVFENVEITNFGDFFIGRVRAKVSLSTVIIESQNPDENEFWVSGNGTMDEGVVTLSYVIVDSNSSQENICNNNVWTMQ